MSPTVFHLFPSSIFLGWVIRKRGLVWSCVAHGVHGLDYTRFGLHLSLNIGLNSGAELLTQPDDLWFRLTLSIFRLGCELKFLLIKKWVGYGLIPFLLFNQSN